MQENQSENTLFDVFISLRKHSFWMLIIFTAIVLLVTILTFMQTPTYEVMSNVMVKYGREYVYRSVSQVESADVKPLYMFNELEVINTELEIFRSKELAEKIIHSLGIEKLFPKLSRKEKDKDRLLSMALNRFGKQLNVFHLKESNVISVTFQHQDPELAVKTVALLTEFFKERHLQIFKNPQAAFLEQQVVLYRRQMQQSENALRKYKQENLIFSLEHQQEILMNQYVEVHTLLIEGNSSLMELGKKISSLEEELKIVPAEVLQVEESTMKNNDISEGSAHSNLLKLQLEESQLMEKYPENHRLVVAVRKDIKMVQEFIASLEKDSEDTVRKGRNYVFQELKLKLGITKVDYTAQKAKNEELQRQLDQLEMQLQKRTEQEIEFRELTLQVETAEQTYKNFTSKLEDSRIQDAMDREKMVNVVVIEKPMVPIKPIKPRKKLNILVGIILGAASSLSYALFVEYVMVRKT